ncbi:hypothetical protein F183_A01930 [Bryobacterales bacterium F-183]|nr:hypothetical protein F183_A01930 [Bryobacterales bacterium F-183]
MTRREAVTLIAASPMLLGASAAKPWKVLIVVAHPDDEYYFAATVYRIAQELGGTVDQVIITNGEAGYRYSTLAEKIYGVPLTDESTGRSRLPEIRKKETLSAGRILGIRNHYFLSERDHRFTLDAGETLDDVWNCGRVRETLRGLLERERYDFVFTILPRESTHGHHQAAALLALETIAKLEPAEHRPVVLGAEPAADESHAPGFGGLSRFELTRTARPEPEFAFNRRRTFGLNAALRYEIVVNWVIAEHKSQGMFQNDAGKHGLELFWRFESGPPDAAERTAALAHAL